MATATGRHEPIAIRAIVVRGLSTLFVYFLPFFGLSLLLVGIPALIAQALLPEGDAYLTFIMPIQMLTSPRHFVIWLVTFCSSAWLQAVVVRTSILHFSGRRGDVRQSFVNTFGIILPVLGASILTSLFAYVGMLALLIPGILLFLMFSVIVPVQVEERGGIRHSIARSCQLTKGSRMRIAMLYLMFWVAYMALFFVVMMVAGTILTLAGVEDFAPYAMILVSVFSAMLGATMVASLYSELRGKKEGVSTEGLADIFA